MILKDKKYSQKKNRFKVVQKEIDKTPGTNAVAEVPYLKECNTKSIAETIHFAHQNKSNIVVGVSLASGLYLEGNIIDIAQKDHHGYNICFYQPQNGVTYFYTHSIIAITVRQSLSVAINFSNCNTQPLCR